MVETASLELGHKSRPDERDTNRRILEGIGETLQGSSTSEDAVSRLAPKQLPMPRLTVGTNGVKLDRYCQALKFLQKVLKGFCVYAGVYATVLCDMH